MLTALLDMVFPPVSLAGERGKWVTPHELRELRTQPLRLEEKVLRALGVRYVDRIVAAASYGGSPLLREAVHRFKYRRVRAYAEVLCGLLVQASQLLPEWPECVLTPVPLHWMRRYSRGFNQSDILAQAVSCERSWPISPLLERRAITGTQVGRTQRERKHAVRNAFTFVGGRIPPRVVLVDDVATTGATLDACAKALKDAGVMRVEALVLAVGFS